MDGAGPRFYLILMSTEDVSTALGRPRAFCADAALAAALRVFWSRGFEGTSLSDLTEAMGINRPSLYAAFGNKEALFRKALDLYESERSAFMQDALAAPTARAVAERFLQGATAFHGEGDGPKGCLLVSHSVACGPEAEGVRIDVALRQSRMEAALMERFKRAKADRDLPDSIEPDGLARLLLAIVQGMAVQAGSGAPRADLERLADATLAIWPGR